jgi:POT family proton-dependent oligopeptide transporter
MAAAFLLFAVGKKHYPQENVMGLPPKTPEQKAAEWATLGRIAGVFGLISVWWFVYDQSASTWIYFADKHMDMTVIGSWKTTPDSVQGFNPLFIVILTPVFNWMWLFIKQRRKGVDLPDTQKMFLGFIIVVACMAMMAVAGYVGANEKITVWWLIIATFIITLSELCVSVIGLEFAFRVALPGTKSVVTGAFFFSVFAGDTGGTFYSKWLWGSISPGAYFAIQTAIMTVTAAAFYFVARRFERSESAHAAAA